MAFALILFLKNGDSSNFWVWSGVLVLLYAKYPPPNLSFYFSPLTPTHKQKREASSLHDVTSDWLHGNSIPNIGWHYFWPGLIENTPTNPI